MVTDYRDYKPVVFDTISLEQIASPDYQRFIESATIEPGVRLLLARRAIRPDWPFIDTKFNPNTGLDLPADRYDVIFGWMLGRGCESLAGHLAVLDSLPSLTAAERGEARVYFSQLLPDTAAAIVSILDANHGRCPFCVNRRFEAVDATGQPVEVPTNVRGAADLFVGKGLVAAGSPGHLARGLAKLVDGAEFVRRNGYADQQGADLTNKISTGPRMLMQAVPLLVREQTADPAMRKIALDIAADFLRFILDHHYDESAGTYSEQIRADSFERATWFDPGHATEFVGLGLGAVEAMEVEPNYLTDDLRSLVQRAKVMLPRLVVWAVQVGWNHRHDGLHKAVDWKTGQVLNDDMPWWNLPETMRAVVRSLEVSREESLRPKLLECFRLCHNAYFGRYLNRDKMLFPYQTRSGATGLVADKVPAVPEGDPLYHTNLAMLDMLTVLRRVW